MSLASGGLLLRMAAQACMAVTGACTCQAPAGGSPAPGVQAPVQDPARAENERRAAGALEKMGVPLQRDALGRVRWIEAANGELTDEAMRHLPSLFWLEWLEAAGGKATAAGMARLGDCPSLRRLYVHDVDLGGDPLTWLAGLEHLEALSLQRTGITGAALRNVKAAATLTVLNIGDNDIGDGDLEPVTRMARLEVLALQNTKITGAGLAGLKGMQRLNVLNVSNCRIFEGDLDVFESIPNLRIVHAAGCDIDETAIREITGKLPMLSIFP